MNSLRVIWVNEVSTLLSIAKVEIEKRVEAGITVEWDNQTDIVEPKFKINSRLAHHAPHVIPDKRNGAKGHLTDSKSIVVAAIGEIWDRYKVEHAVVLNYDLWLKENISNNTAELSNEEYAEHMRVKRQRDANEKEKTSS